MNLKIVIFKDQRRGSNRFDCREYRKRQRRVEAFKKSLFGTCFGQDEKRPTSSGFGRVEVGSLRRRGLQVLIDLKTRFLLKLFI